jgi:GNAT superfamily N-acetyltransferase
VSGDRPLPGGLVIRPAAEEDVAQIERLVLEVVREVYGDLIPEEPPRPDGNWRCGVVAEIDGLIAGVVVADGDWVEDLWVARAYRNRGIGGVLLRAAERQIAARDYAKGRLRVVADNLDARRFYGARGWVETVSHPHETWGFLMCEMAKTLAATDNGMGR